MTIIALVLLFTSCTKLGTPEIDNESQSTQDAVIADQEFTGIIAPLFRHIVVTRAAVSSSKKLGQLPMKFEGGDTINFQPAPVFSLDAALLGAGADGKIRSGSIRLTFNKPFDQQGAVTRIQLQDYVADGVSYQAESFTLTTIAESGNYFAVDMGLIGGTCSVNDKSFQFSANRRLSLFYTGGLLAAGPYLTMYGTGSGMSRTGLSYTVAVLTDVFKANNCRYFTSGKLQFNPSGYKERMVEFGDGTCDELGFYTIGENKVAFKLK